MQFKKYPSIDNAYRKKTVDAIVQYGLSGGTWTVSEKIHGSHMSLHCDGVDVKPAKRTGFIGDDEGFYGCESVVERISPSIRKIFNIVKEWLIEGGEVVTEISVHGEYFGGSYPHNDVARESHATTVQNGIFYCPHNEFVGYDIEVNGEYLNKLVVYGIFEDVGLLCFGSLFKGTFQECLAYSNQFQTTVPAKFGLPEIADNFCEGVVLEPIIPVRFNCGSRVILKNKNSKWSEKSVIKTPKEPIELSEVAMNALTEIQSYVTENRLHNVLSHIGEVSNKEFGKVMGLYTQDVLEDVGKDHEDIFEAIEKDEVKRVKKQFSKTVAELIRKNFLDIIDGTF